MNEIRLAEDQMRELKLCILAGNVWTMKICKSSQQAWKTAKTLLCFENNDEPLDNSGISCSGKEHKPTVGMLGPSLSENGILQMENEGLSERIAELLDCIMQLKKEIYSLRYESEPPDDSGTKQPDLLGQICVLQNRNAGLQQLCDSLRDESERSMKDATYWREQVEGTAPGQERAYDMLQTKIEELEKLVPKERLKVRLVRGRYEFNDWWWTVVRDTPNKTALQISDPMLRPNALQWAEDHGFEVVT